MFTDQAVKKFTSSGITASAPSLSITSTTLLLAVGWNLTKISPTNPTLGFFISFISRLSKSLIIFFMLFLNVDNLAFFNDSLQISTHLS